MSEDRPSGVAATEPPPPAPAESEGPQHQNFRAGSWAGRVIDGRYRVLSLLGEGGMGAVFLAEHTKLEKRVALKVILPQFAGDGEVAERFAREAMASARIDHPHVASALDYGALPEGGAYLVMQYIRGRSLRDALSQGATGWRFAAEVGGQIADALAAAHAQRIVHRDLKPENVILEPRDDGSEMVKVLDFGVARVASENEEASGQSGRALTRIGTVIGTPGYMAPEQALGEAVDHRADLYALGVVLWELVAGRSLFESHDLTVIVTEQLTTVPAPLKSFDPSVPAELEELVGKLLARPREQRPERANEVREVLRKVALGATLERSVLSGELAMSPTLLARAAPSTPRLPPAILDPARAPSAIVESVSRLRARWNRELAEGAVIEAGPLGPLPRSFVTFGCAVPALLTTLLFGLVIAFGGSHDAPSNPSLLADTQAAPEAPQLPSGSDEPEEPTRAEVEPGVAPSSERLRAEIAEDVELLVESDRGNVRTAAARRLREAGELPAFVSHLVKIELDNRCNERRRAIRALGELGDPRALPALLRFDRTRRGCGFLGTQDCYRCIRRELDQVVPALTARARD